MTQVDFAIITNRLDEFEAILRRFPAAIHTGTSGRAYGIGQVQAKTDDTCTVAFVRGSEQGNDVAQQIANDMINDLNPQLFLVVGTASGVPSNNFTLGDVIISTSISSFNVSKRYEDGTQKFDMRKGINPTVSDIAANLPLYQKELADWNVSTAITMSRPTLDLSPFDTAAFKMKISANADKDVAAWYKDLQASFINHAGSTRSPVFKTGTIAVSNHIIRDTDLFVKWLQKTPSILAVEMETAGVYQATQRIRQQYPVMAIRGISDIIGLERDYQWTQYACQTAAAFTYALVTAGIITPRVKSTVRGDNPIRWEEIQRKLRYKLGELFP